MENFQQLFNWALTLCGALGFIIIKDIIDTLKELRKKDNEILERMLAGFTPKPDFEKQIDTLFEKLDRMDEKLDTVFLRRNNNDLHS